MPEALATFLSSYTENIPVPEHMALVCQVLYLFLEFDDDKHRTAQLKDLFYKHSNQDYFQKLEECVRQDKKALACLQAAEQAVVSGEIEQYQKDYDFERFERDKLKRPEFYTVSFLAWAEAAGYQIPANIMTEMKRSIENYFYFKSSREEEKRKFQRIDRQEFERRTNEPLWKMTDAVLYALDYQSDANEEAKIGFLRYKERFSQWWSNGKIPCKYL